MKNSEWYCKDCIGKIAIDFSKMNVLVKHGSGCYAYGNKKAGKVVNRIMERGREEIAKENNS